MNTAEVLAALRQNQMAFVILVVLQLTGYLFPPKFLLQNKDTFDYIIVGCGTAGSVIASRLVQKEYNVLVIEAGPDAPYETTIPALVNYAKNTDVDWNYTTTDDKYTYQCQVNKTLDLGLGRMIGGSGEVTYMTYSRGHPENFNEWYRITGDPIWKWDNVLPYFKKSENVSDSAIQNSEYKDMFGTNGYIGVTRDDQPTTDEILEAFRQAGKEIIPDTDGNRIGFSKTLLTIKDGLRQGAGPRYMSQISESRYIAMAKNTYATKIIFDEFKKAIGVEVITDEGEKLVINARKEIILTAGAIKSPQILMLSGVGLTEDLQKLNIETVSHLPVGSNLQDHVGAFIAHKTNKNLVKIDKDPGKFPVGRFMGYATLNNSKHHGEFYYNVLPYHDGFHYHHDKNNDSYNHEFLNYEKIPKYAVVGYAIDDLKFLIQYCASTFKFPEKTCNKLHDEADNNLVILSIISDLYARSRGQVKLRSADPMDPPNVLLGTFSYDRDLEDFVDYVLDYLKVENTEAFKKLGASRIDLTTPRCDEFIKDSREYWRCSILCSMVSLRTYAGTCSMGSVVDSRMRVFGVRGLRVADSSIMPTIVTGPTFNTAVMIGEKASDLIIEAAGEEYNSMSHDKVNIDQVENMPKQ